jgi:hypothetical protein
MMKVTTSQNVRHISKPAGPCIEHLTKISPVIDSSPEIRSAIVVLFPYNKIYGV